MRRAMWICMLVVALAVTIAACGGDDEPAPPMSDEEEIVAAVNGFFAALIDDDGELACSFLTERGQRLMHTVARRQFPTEIGEGADCEAVIAVSSEQLEDEEARSVAEYTYTADGVSIEEGASKAYAQCEFRGAIFMRRSGSDWLIDFPACID